MLTIFPLTVWIRVAQPTEQKGQMLGVVFASLIRSSCARAVAGASVTPSPTIPPLAVPARALAVSRTKSRRLTCIRSSPLRSGVACAKPVGRDDIRIAFGGRNPGASGTRAVALESAPQAERGRGPMLELPELTPESFEILAVRELRKVGLEVSPLRVHRRATLPEPERGYLLELKGVISRARWQRRILIACRRQQGPIGRAAVESLRDHLTDAGGEAGILFGPAAFEADALNAVQASPLALLRVSDGRTAFDTSGWGTPGHYPAWLPAYYAQTVERDLLGQPRYQLLESGQGDVMVSRLGTEAASPNRGEPADHPKAPE